MVQLLWVVWKSEFDTELGLTELKGMLCFGKVCAQLSASLVWKAITVVYVVKLTQRYQFFVTANMTEIVL